MNSSWNSAAHVLGISSLLALLTACGGGGGGSAATTPSSQTSVATPSTVEVNPPSASAPEPGNTLLPYSNTWFADMPAPASAPSGVFISEVANNYFSQSAGWIEIYNHSGASIDLSQYSLRTTAIQLSTQDRSESVAFALPPLTIPHNGYVVLSSRVRSDLQTTPNNVYLSNAQNQVPYWQGDSGFMELLASGATVDFVAFGSSNAKPSTAGRWNGMNVQAMAHTSDSYNTSIVRPFAHFRQTMSASDWEYVNFATPGGINDVAAGVVDSDRDGIPDSAKTPGGTYGGLNLYAMGARKGQRDLFVHLDYLESSDAGTQPSTAALNKIVQAFGKHQIALHFDAGNLFTARQDGSQHNLSGDISHQRPAQNCIQLVAASQLSTGCNTVDSVKSAHFDIRRKPIFRYLLMATSQQPDGRAGASGSAELLGDNFLVTLGGWGLKEGSAQQINYQAATIMHELGHTLGLRHGGFEDAPNKPNYYSVMNYFYQTTGLPNVTGLGISQRYYYWLTNYQNKSAAGYSPSNPFLESQLDDGPQSQTFKIDYSDGSAAPLDEQALLESQLIGRGTAAGYFADWNGDGVETSTPLDMDLNGSGSKSILKDHNDWDNLVLNTRRLVSANTHGISMPCHSQKTAPAHETHAASPTRSGQSLLCDAAR